MKVNWLLNYRGGSFLTGDDSRMAQQARLRGVSFAEIDEAQANALYEAGCRDATAGVFCGRAHMDFDRKAASLAHAVTSALRQIKRVGLTPDHIEPEDLVSAAEIAERSGSTRQSISNYVMGKRCKGCFPSPVARVTTSSPLWRWTEVASYLVASRRIEKSVVEEAYTLVRLNKKLRYMVSRTQGRKGAMEAR